MKTTFLLDPLGPISAAENSLMETIRQRQENSDVTGSTTAAENALMDTIRERQKNSKMMTLYKMKNRLQKRFTLY